MIGHGVARLPICSGGDTRHRHRVGCLPLLVRHLPPAPVGWRWAFGQLPTGWGVWLERVGGAGARWYVVGLPTVDTVGGLVAVVEAYAAGLRGGGLIE